MNKRIVLDAAGIVIDRKIYMSSSGETFIIKDYYGRKIIVNLLKIFVLGTMSVVCHVWRMLVWLSLCRWMLKCEKNRKVCD